jgi:Holliday junction resolvase
MAINSRAKGIRFERQLCQILTERTGKKITRNWHEQTAVGGYDLEGLEKFAIEVKACKKTSLNEWWQQTLTQANNSQRIPLLAYKRPLLPWKFVVELNVLNPLLGKETIELDIDGFISIINYYKLV